MSQDQQKQPIEWTVVKEFGHESGIVVQVSKSTEKYPKFSFQLGRVGKSGVTGRWIGWQKKARTQELEIELDVAEIVAGLVFQAQKWATEQMKETFSPWVDRPVEEKATQNRKPNKPVVARLGKTARDRAKKGVKK